MRLCRIWIAAATVTILASPAAAEEGMTVAELLRRLDDGHIRMAALVSPRTRPALMELKRSGDALKAAEASRRSTGRGPSFCPPKNGSMGLPQLVAAFRALPADEQQQPVRTALPAVMRARFPCAGAVRPPLVGAPPP
ncbi:MAG TPA: hypothetical protein VF699_03950 [Caulobacteraceae bacterium]|jgi:hypothetical protein